MKDDDSVIAKHFKDDFKTARSRLGKYCHTVSPVKVKFGPW